MLKEIGFDAISPDCKSEGALSELSEIASTAGKCGLVIQSLHAPTAKAADMWSKDLHVSSDAKKDLLTALHACVQYDIPILVVHAWRGIGYSFSAEALNYANFDEIVSFAAQHNIKIAFEIIIIIRLFLVIFMINNCST